MFSSIDNESPSHPPHHLEVPTEGNPITPSYKARRKLNNPERKRHGARNQDKSKLFCRWLVETFPEILLHNNKIDSGSDLSNNTNSDAKSSSTSLSSTSVVILDVAGGKGEVAARLCVCHRHTVILVDPRQCDPIQCFRAQVFKQLPQKWQERLSNRTKDDPNFLANLFRDRFQQLTMYFDHDTCQASDELNEALHRASLLLGMHADSATEAIVDVALQHNKPFCVVPCCVFPNLFHQRQVYESGRYVPVRTHEQFCQYLLDKDPRLQRSVLPFEGRNVAIWWKGL